MKANEIKDIVVNSIFNNAVNIAYKKDNKVIYTLGMFIVDADENVNQFIDVCDDNMKRTRINVNDIVKIVPRIA